MRVIIAGGRDFGTKSPLARSMALHRIDRAMNAIAGNTGESAPDWRGWSVVCGLAAGADQLGAEWAEQNGVAVAEFPAKWVRPDGTPDRGAGFKRNLEMAKNADALIAFWDGQSKGTKNMIDQALQHGLEVHVYRYETVEETF